jgi:hypothetical protein
MISINERKEQIDSIQIVRQRRRLKQNRKTQQMTTSLFYLNAALEVAGTE